VSSIAENVFEHLAEISPEDWREQRDYLLEGIEQAKVAGDLYRLYNYLRMYFRQCDHACEYLGVNPLTGQPLPGGGEVDA
jgi:hypothetical protein